MFGFNFGYSSLNSNNNNNNNHQQQQYQRQNSASPTSPTRNSVWGSPYSPFKATNVPPPDITMDYTTAIVKNGLTAKPQAALQPTGSMGGGGGQGSNQPVRTMRDYEEQLAALKKENFNLKLRIYLLEERMNINPADEHQLKKDLELRLEYENLKKELQEKQVLLGQAAQAMKLIEDKTKEDEQVKFECQKLLQEEQNKNNDLEKELEILKAKLRDSQESAELFGLTAEKILEFNDKLHQYEEIKLSLESQLKQISSSLEEERNWAAELESERDSLKQRLETEMMSRESYIAKKDQEFESLKRKVLELEEQLFKKENLLQQHKKELIEKEEVIVKKCKLLEDKNREYEEITAIADKRKKQVDQMRLSIKSRDDALTDLNEQNRQLMFQVENNFRRLESSRSSLIYSADESPNSRTFFDSSSPKKCFRGNCNREPCLDRTKYTYDVQSDSDRRDLEDMKKRVSDKERNLKLLEEAQKQLKSKLLQMEQLDSQKEQKLKKLETDYRKALQTIKGFIQRRESIDEKEVRNANRLMELESENSKLKIELARVGRNSANMSAKKNLFSDFAVDNPERDQCGQQRLEDMDYKIDELRDQINTVIAEKCLLEKQAQIESEELHDRLHDRELKIEYLECERNSLKDELQEIKEELTKLKDAYNVLSVKPDTPDVADENKNESPKKPEEENNHPIEKLNKELLTKTQSLQKLVNMELWNKHNQSSGGQLNSLVKELNDIGIQVTFTNDIVQLNYMTESGVTVDVATITDYMKKLIAQKSELEREVSNLKWMKFESKSLDALDITDKNKKYCEVLRTHLKDLMKFMKEMLKDPDNMDMTCNKNNKLVFEILANSKMLSDDFINALENMSLSNVSVASDFDNKVDGTPSDSETFSEPDRTVSFARIGLQEAKPKNDLKSMSDSEDSMEYQPNNDFDANRQLANLKDFHNYLFMELLGLRTDIMDHTDFNHTIDGRLTQLLSKLESTQKLCEKLRLTIEKKIHECCTLKKESKQNSVRKTQLEKRALDAENLASEVSKQKAELLQYLENVDRQSTDMLASLNKENEVLRNEIKKLENEIEGMKATISRLTKELDLLNMKHTQTLVENSKLSNEKLRLEQEARKSEARYEVAIKSLQCKFSKEVSDLNQINESHQTRMQELEASNKELRRHVVACEASDSGPSSSGISSMPHEVNAKHTFEDITNYHGYHISPWRQLPFTYAASSGRSKSSCSPDLGIESDGALSSMRPLKQTLKSTESIANLFSDDDNCNSQGHRDTDSESPLPREGLDEVGVLKQENEALKRRLSRTRKALEDTFQHLSTSNKNKKNVEKAITKQLAITKSILKKTRNFEEQGLENS